jgi:hypothetical protein
LHRCPSNTTLEVLHRRAVFFHSRFPISYYRLQ